MTTPIETMEWLDLQFRARANEDGEAHTAQDADQVETARRAFNGMLESLKTLTTQARGVIDTVSREDVPEWFAAVEAAEATIAAAEGREIADAPAGLPRGPVIPVDALEWQEIGEEHQPKARLLAALQIGDCMFHVEAREIDSEADPQSTLEYGDDLDRFANIQGQSDFATMTREGREYFVFILPYEA